MGDMADDHAGLYEPESCEDLSEYQMFRRFMARLEQSARSTRVAGRGEWKQRDGKVIRITEMDDEHLENTIKMLQNSMKQWQFRVMYSGLSESDVEKIASLDRHTLALIRSDKYRELWDEWRRRSGMATLTAKVASTDRPLHINCRSAEDFAQSDLNGRCRERTRELRTETKTIKKKRKTKSGKAKKVDARRAKTRKRSR